VYEPVLIQSPRCAEKFVGVVLQSGCRFINNGEVASSGFLWDVVAASADHR
jgi:hypothetical protein